MVTSVADDVSHSQGIVVPEADGIHDPRQSAQAVKNSTPPSNQNEPFQPPQAKSDQDTSASSYPQSRISLVNRSIDEPRPLNVGVIGGGLAGVLAGILLPAKVPNIRLTIYEKNKDFVCLFQFQIDLPKRIV